MPSNRRIIAGRPVMITGAASGIGQSLARLLSRSGSLEKRLRSRQAARGEAE